MVTGISKEDTECGNSCADIGHRGEVVVSGHESIMTTLSAINGAVLGQEFATNTL